MKLPKPTRPSPRQARIALAVVAIVAGVYAIVNDHAGAGVLAAATGVLAIVLTSLAYVAQRRSEPRDIFEDTSDEAPSNGDTE